MNLNLKIIFIILSYLFCTNFVSANEGTEEKIRNDINKKFSDTSIVIGEINKVEPLGLYEVEINNNFLYVSEDLKWLVKGDIFNFKTDKNFTQAREYERSISQIKSFKNFITYQSDNEKRVAYVFTDPTCPYCHRLHENIDILNEYGVTVKYIPFPRNGLSGKGYEQSAEIWCQEDKKKAYNKISNNQTDKEYKKPTNECYNIVKNGFELGNNVKVSGTPKTYISNGVISNGFSNVADLLIKADLLDPSNPEELKKIQNKIQFKGLN